MNLFNIALLSFLSAIVLFILAKLMGNKQISQLSLFDYITGITIGSIGAEMATDLDKSPWVGIVAMSVYAIIGYGISFFTSKSVGLRKIITGRTILLYNNKIFYKKNMNKARLDLSDLFTLLRIQGYFSMSDIQTIILEQNGQISVLPVSSRRSATPEDLNLQVTNDGIITNVIVDGEVLDNNLKIIKKDNKWLNEKIQFQGYHSSKDIFLATVDNNDNLSIYNCTIDKNNPDWFE